MGDRYSLARAAGYLNRLHRLLDLDPESGPGRFNPGKKVVNRGFQIGIHRPGDGYTRYALEYYDGSGTGCRDVLHGRGWEDFSSKMSAFADGLDFRRLARL